MLPFRGSRARFFFDMLKIHARRGLNLDCSSTILKSPGDRVEGYIGPAQGQARQDFGLGLATPSGWGNPRLGMTPQEVGVVDDPPRSAHNKGQGQPKLAWTGQPNPVDRLYNYFTPKK